jgi:hypothetical protein
MGVNRVLGNRGDSNYILERPSLRQSEHPSWHPNQTIANAVNGESASGSTKTESTYVYAWLDDIARFQFLKWALDINLPQRYVMPTLDPLNKAAVAWVTESFSWVGESFTRWEASNGVLQQ